MEENNMNEEVKEEQATKNSGEERTMYKATCADCGKDAEVPFKPEEGRPVRCADCFRKQKPQKKFGGPRRDGRGRDGRGRDGFNQRPREMHKATCAECKKEAEVPFKPTEGKPVYCKDCFMKRRQ